MKRKITSFVLSIMMAVTFIPMGLFVHVESVSAASNPYPTTQDVDGDGYYEVPCTRFAWQQVYDNLGIALPSWGNAGEWFQKAKNAGYVTGTEPKVGAVAVWSGGNYGHVAYVTSVSSTSTFTVNEGGRTDLDATTSHGVDYGYKITNPVGSARPYDTGKILLGFIYPKGFSKEEVEWIQSSLKTLGYSINVDGNYGDATKAVVKQFQKDNGLTVDGMAGASTQNKIRFLLAIKDIDVVWLQSSLKTLGYSINVDGDYGAATTAVVKQFQKDNGLTVDGIAGASTQNKIQLLLDLKDLDVVWLQSSLKTLGYSINVDGNYGDATKAVVKQFQKDNGLTVDGMAGASTQNKIRFLLAIKDIDVVWLQSSLKTLGYSINVDGDYGAATTAVVKQFQKDNGLTVDGIAGASTQNKIQDLLVLKDLDVVNHDFSKYVPNGDGTHKIVCQDCGTIQEGHDKDACTGGTATCTSKAVCTVCGLEYGELKAHTYETTWKSDSSNHWYACTVCGAKKDSAAHTLKTIIDKAATTTETGSKHDECTVCGYKKASVVIEKVPALHTTHSGGVATCKDKAICEVCGAEYGELKAHSYGTAWKSDSTNHYHACTVCGAKKDSAAHTLKTIIDKAATTTETGSKHDECTVCGYAKAAVVIDKIPAEHAHSGGTATCTAKAKCEVCGAEYGELAAHSYSEATCTSKAKCTVCGAETGELAAHKLATATVKKATMSVNGKTETKCEVCGKVTKTATVYAAKTVKLSKSKYAYSGKAITPAALVTNSKGTKLVKGTDYTVSMTKGRTKVGTYKITIKGKGKYSFTKDLTLTIKPNPTPIVKVTPGKKSFTVKWTKKTVQVDGYEIQYSTSSGFKTGNKAATIKSNKTTSRVCKSLKAKKTYYVRVRTYKTVNGKKIYSVWSAKKSVKTK